MATDSTGVIDSFSFNIAERNTFPTLTQWSPTIIIPRLHSELSHDTFEHETETIYPFAEITRTFTGLKYTNIYTGRPRELNETCHMALNNEQTKDSPRSREALLHHYLINFVSFIIFHFSTIISSSSIIIL